MEEKCPEFHKVLNPVTKKCLDVNGSTFYKLFMDKGWNYPWRPSDIPKIKEMISQHPKFNKKTLPPVHDSKSPSHNSQKSNVHSLDYYINAEHKQFCLNEKDPNVLYRSLFLYRKGITTWQNKINVSGLNVSSKKKKVESAFAWNNYLQKAIDPFLSYNRVPHFSLWEQYNTSWFDKSNDYIRDLPPYEKTCLISFMTHKDLFENAQYDALITDPKILNPFILHAYPSLVFFPLHEKYIPYSHKWMTFMQTELKYETKQKIKEIMTYAFTIIDQILRDAPKTQNDLLLFDTKPKPKSKSNTSPSFVQAMAHPIALMTMQPETIVRRIFVPSGTPALFIAPLLPEPEKMDIVIGRENVSLVKDMKKEEKRIFPGLISAQHLLFTEQPRYEKFQNSFLKSIFCGTENISVYLIDYHITQDDKIASPKDEKQI